jgi:hypothetical protein
LHVFGYSAPSSLKQWCKIGFQVFWHSLQKVKHNFPQESPCETHLMNRIVQKWPYVSYENKTWKLHSFSQCHWFLVLWKAFGVWNSNFLPTVSKELRPPANTQWLSYLIKDSFRSTCKLHDWSLPNILTTPYALSLSQPTNTFEFLIIRTRKITNICYF